jgi:hypothetical protein
VISGQKVKRLYLASANIWAEWSLMGTPRYLLYEFVGYNIALDQYFFKGRKTNKLLVKTMNQLELAGRGGSFRPFLIDTERLDSKHLITLG